VALVGVSLDRDQALVDPSEHGLNFYSVLMITGVFLAVQVRPQPVPLTALGDGAVCTGDNADLAVQSLFGILATCIRGRKGRFVGRMLLMMYNLGVVMTALGTSILFLSAPPRPRGAPEASTVARVSMALLCGRATRSAALSNIRFVIVWVDAARCS
jgi:hypothetical protein